MKNMQILVYVTNNPDKVVSGDPLCLCIKDEKEKQQTLLEISRALRANVVQLKNGDYMIVNQA
jgi:hypothetical protein